MSTYVYNANQVALAVCNIPIDSGFDDGEFVTIEKDADDWISVVGTDGAVAMCATNNQLHTVKVKLLQVSPANDRLSALRTLQVASGNGVGVGPFLLKDLLGTSLYSGLHTFVGKPPDVSYDRGAKVRVWTLVVTDMLRFDGGNTPI